MSRRATVRTVVDGPELVAASVTPDNTPEIRTTTDDDAVVTVVERESTSGLRSTVDDYVVNLAVAVEVAQHAERITHTNHE